MAPPGPIFIIGTRPQIGNHIARLFVTHNFRRVAFFSDNIDNLNDAVTSITSITPDIFIRTYSVSMTNPEFFGYVLSQAVVEVGAPEVVVYNCTRYGFGMLEQYGPVEILADWKYSCLGLCTTARFLVPHLRALAQISPGAHPALFVYSSALFYSPIPLQFSLSMARAAQANLVTMLAMDNTDVVHVALVVGPSEYVDDPSHVAAKFWELYEQQRGTWVWEITV